MLVELVAQQWMLKSKLQLEMVTFPKVCFLIFMDPEKEILTFVLLSDNPTIFLQNDFHYLSKALLGLMLRQIYVGKISYPFTFSRKFRA